MCKFKSCREYQILSACSPTAEAAILNIVQVKVQIFSRAYSHEDVGKRLSRQPFKLKIAGSIPVVLAKINFRFQIKFEIWNLKFSSEYSQADKGVGLQNQSSSVQIRLLAPIFIDVFGANAECDYIAKW